MADFVLLNCCLTIRISFNFCRLKKDARAVSCLAELGNDWRNYDVIGIDEGQFYSDVSHLIFAKNVLLANNFSVKVVEFCDQASHEGKIVIVSALGATYLREGFNSILELIPKAEKIKQLHAICQLCYH